MANHLLSKNATEGETVQKDSMLDDFRYDNANEQVVSQRVNDLGNCQ